MKTQVRPWAVFRLPSAEETSICVARFRSRTDADAYSVILHRVSPEAKFQVVFDKDKED